MTSAGPSRLVARLGRANLLLVIAGVLAVLALALPWTSSADATITPGTMVPGFCTSVSDQYGGLSMSCTPPAFYPGFYIPGVGAAGGFATPIRVFLLAVIVLVVLARRRRSTRLAVAAMIVAAAGLAATALLPRPGEIAYLAGLLMLGLALRADGLLHRGRQAAISG